MSKVLEKLENLMDNKFYSVCVNEKECEIIFNDTIEKYPEDTEYQFLLWLDSNSDELVGSLLYPIYISDSFKVSISWVSNE